MLKALKALRRQLPAAMPLSGLSIGAVGDRVVVKEGASRRHAESGQYLLAFEGDPSAGELRVVDRRVDPEEPAEAGYDLHQAGKLAEAERAYREALKTSAEPLLHYNFAVLLEDLGRDAEAMESYRAALRGDPALADGYYNLALLCEKLGRAQEAIRHMAQYRKLVAKK